MIVQVVAPDSYRGHMTAQEIAAWLESVLAENAPCEICGGSGVVGTGDGNHYGPDNPDVACPVCMYEKWRKPV